MGPEHQFPAAHDDIVAAYLWLLGRGHRPADIIVAGDSAGGHISLSLCGELRRRDLPMPAGLVLFSPLVDGSFTAATEEYRRNGDPMVVPALARRLIRHYFRTAEHGDPRYPALRVLLMSGYTEATGSAEVPPQFTQGYGLAFGGSERKAMAMALVDRALRARELDEPMVAPAQDEEFVMAHSDNVEASGFVQHLKLPHYVTFESELQMVRALREGRNWIHFPSGDASAIAGFAPPNV